MIYGSGRYPEKFTCTIRPRSKPVEQLIASSLRLERHDMMRRIHDDITGSVLEGDIIHIQYPVNVISNLGCSCQSVRIVHQRSAPVHHRTANPEPKDTREKPQKKTAMIDNYI
jgi:hypothetical protein